jgi:hypothetical protein
LNTIDDYAEWTHKLAVYPDVNTGSKLELPSMWVDDWSEIDAEALP